MNMFTVCSKLGEQSTVDVCTYEPKAQEHLRNYARGTRAYESTIDYSPCSYMNIRILTIIHTSVLSLLTYCINFLLVHLYVSLIDTYQT